LLRKAAGLSDMCGGAGMKVGELRPSDASQRVYRQTEKMASELCSEAILHWVKSFQEFR